MSKEKKDFIVGLQFFVINTLSALLSGSIMQLFIIFLIGGQPMKLDSLIHIAVFITILTTSVIFGYILLILFTFISLLIVIKIGNRT